jgi:hypothetical protein
MARARKPIQVKCGSCKELIHLQPGQIELVLEPGAAFMRFVCQHRDCGQRNERNVSDDMIIWLVRWRHQAP